LHPYLINKEGGHMEIKRIAFLETYKTENSVMGVVMVTDAQTKPIEFRVTSSINPTNFQKVLYGNVLHEHIAVELVALPLLEAVNEELDLILVKDPLFLGANEKQNTRIVRVFNGSGNATHNHSQLQLKPANGKPEPTFLETSKNLEGELKSIYDILAEISENRDLLEPFDRLTMACEQVHLKKTKD